MRARRLRAQVPERRRHCRRRFRAFADGRRGRAERGEPPAKWLGSFPPRRPDQPLGRDGAAYARGRRRSRTAPHSRASRRGGSKLRRAPSPMNPGHSEFRLANSRRRQPHIERRHGAAREPLGRARQGTAVPSARVMLLSAPQTSTARAPALVAGWPLTTTLSPTLKVAAENPRSRSADTAEGPK